MKALLCSLVLASITITPGFSQERASTKRTWLRRLTLAGACAASLWDVRTTQSAVASGAYETNALFSDRAGNPRFGRMVGFKLGACAGMGVAQEFGLFGRARNSDSGWIAANTSMAGTFAAISIYNKSVASNSN
jgi:hypothetical protein